MKVGIIGFANLGYMPYLRVYTDIFDEFNVEYEIIYWNRKGIDEKWNSNTIVFEEKMEDSIAKIGKIRSMLRYKKFIKKRLEGEKYDLLVILTTIPAILLSNYLKINYSNKYIVDIRDYTYENIMIYKKILKNVINKCAITVISSDYFKEFLPDKRKYVLCNNLNIPVNGNRLIRSEKERIKNVINISYIGAIGYFSEVVRFLELIKNDVRFKLSFYGSGTDENAIQDYCTLNDIKNVSFHGMYEPHEKEEFYRDTDIIYNVYGNDTPLVKYALSNKLYEAAWYKIPILVSPSTAMSQISGYLGYKIDYLNKDLADELFIWYNKLIDWNEIDKISEELINTAKKQNDAFKSEIIKLINRKEIIL